MQNAGFIHQDRRQRWILNKGNWAGAWRRQPTRVSKAEYPSLSVRTYSSSRGEPEVSALLWRSSINSIIWAGHLLARISNIIKMRHAEYMLHNIYRALLHSSLTSSSKVHYSLVFNWGCHSSLCKKEHWEIPFYVLVVQITTGKERWTLW